MQEREIEMPVILAVKDILTDYTSHISPFRKKLNDPIIQTPWKFWNDSITNDSILDMISEGALYKATSIQQCGLFHGLEKLERDMLTMDTLQTQLDPLRRKPSFKARGVRQHLQTRILDLSTQIKEQVHSRVDMFLNT